MRVQWKHKISELNLIVEMRGAERREKVELVPMIQSHVELLNELPFHKVQQIAS